MKIKFHFDGCKNATYSLPTKFVPKDKQKNSNAYTSVHIRFLEKNVRIWSAAKENLSFDMSLEKIA